MAIVPSGATIIVVTICAPVSAICSTIIGSDSLKADRSSFQSIPFRCRRGDSGRLRGPARAIAGSRLTAQYITAAAATVSAATVPRAAPSTPIPAPGREIRTSNIS